MTSGLGQTASPRPAANQGIDPSSIRKGDRVKHPRFGVGKVQTVDPVAGDAILTISFEAGGLKRMMARQAPLELL